MAHTHGISPSQMTPGLDRHADTEHKYERAQRRWEMVLDKKHQNTDQKGKYMKEQLAKKFKREKETAIKAKERKELEVYNHEKRADQVMGNVERRQRQDEEVNKKKNTELKKSQKR